MVHVQVRCDEFCFQNDEFVFKIMISERPGAMRDNICMGHLHRILHRFFTPDTFLNRGLDQGLWLDPCCTARGFRKYKLRLLYNNTYQYISTLLVALSLPIR